MPPEPPHQDTPPESKKLSTEDLIYLNTMQRMGSVLTADPVIAVPQGSSDGILSACHLIGFYAGLQFNVQVPHAAAADIQQRIDDICRLSHIRCRRIVLKGRWWDSNVDPLLGFRKVDSSPVALVPSGAGYAAVDPLTNVRTAVTEDNAGDFLPVAYTFYRAFSDVIKPAEVATLFWKGQTRTVIEIACIGVVGALLGLVMPFLTQTLFDDIIPNSDRHSFFQIILASVVAAAGAFSFGIVRSFLLMRMQSVLSIRFKAALWDRMLKLPLSFFREYATGDLIQRAMLVEQLTQIVNRSAISVAVSMLFAMLYLIPMLYFSISLSLMAFGFLAVSVLLSFVYIHYQVYIQRQILELGARLNKFLIQTVQAIAKIRVAGAEKRAFARWGEDFSARETLTYQATRVGNGVAAINIFLSIGATFAVYAIVIRHLEQQAAAPGATEAITIGTLMGFFAAFTPFSSAISSLLEFLYSLVTLRPMWERAKVIVTQKTEVEKSRMEPGELTGSLSVEQLSFHYQNEASQVLHDISFRVDTGESVAIVGYSGMGKSTLARLLIGFETPQKGQILYDHKDLTTLNTEAVRRQMGIILQNTAVFAGTIYENIVCGRHCTLSDIEEAVAYAAFGDVLKTLPMGLYTILPSGGGTLSGGQCQRLLLARALLTKPRILILDEATSNIDNATQEIISHNLDTIHVTRIMIAQRLATIRHASRIYVLDKGSFVDQGTFEELSQRKGLFQQFLKLQKL